MNSNNNNEIYKYTWTQKTQNLKSILDYVIVRKYSQIKTTNVRVHIEPCCGTDQHLVKATFYVPPRKLMIRMKDERKNHQKWNMIQYNLYSLNEESAKTVYQQRLSQNLGENMYRNLQKISMNTCDCIHSAAREALGEQGKGEKRL
jgi:hypothetical protein